MPTDADAEPASPSSGAEQALHRALTAAEVGVWDWDLGSDRMIWSPEYYRLLGLDPATPPSFQAWLAVLHPDDRARADAAARAAATRADWAPIEFRIDHPERGERWLVARGQTSFDAAGTPSRIVGITLDITERKAIGAERERPRAAEATARAELAAILESVGDAFYAVDHDWRVTYANHKAEAILGVRRTELIGRHLWEDFHEVVGSIFEVELRRAMADGVTRSFEAHHEALDLWVEVTAYPAPNGLSVFFRDISGRKRSEQRLERLQAVTAALAEALTPAEVTSVILDQGMAALGARFAALAMLTDEGQTLEMIGHRGYPDDLMADWRRFPIDRPAPMADCARTGTPIFLASAEAVAARSPRDAAATERAGAYGAQAVLPLHAEGRLLGVVVFAFADERIFRADEYAFLLALAGQCAQALGRARLYAAERQARAEAEAAEARYRALFASVADAIVVTDGAGRIVDVNAAALGLLGHAWEELTHLTLPDVAVEREQVEAQQRILVRDGIWRGEAELRRKDGTLAPVDILATRVPLADGRRLYVSIVRDISARRALEAEQRDVLAMVTHDLKGPVAGIQGYAQLMRRRGAYNERGIAAILQEAGRLTRYIDDLLEVSKIDTGRLELATRPLDLGELAREKIEAIRPTTAAHTLRLEAPPEPVRVVGDPDRLAQVLANLLTNAVKYSPDGGEVVVRLEQIGDEARLSVRDQGIGIPPPALPRLFERFYRVEHGQHDGAKGLGLGLYISKGLVAAHGGRIWVESTPGRGSTFAIALPTG